MKMPWATLFVTTVLLTASAIRASGQEPGTRLEYKVQRDIVYARPNGEPLRLDAYVPITAKLRPAVLVIHGGGWAFGSKRQLARYAMALAERGYVAFSIDYRLAPKHPFPAQIEDCRSAVRWIRGNAKQHKVDPRRVGGLGYSAGGHLVTLLGTTGNRKPAERSAPGSKEGAARDQIDTSLQAVVAGGAPCDFRTIPPNASFLSFWLGGTRGEVPDQYKAASPLAFVTRDDPPMFFYHGESDRLVPWISPQAMVKALHEARVEAELYLVENGSHFTAISNHEAIDRALQFLDKHLAPRAAEQ